MLRKFGSLGVYFILFAHHCFLWPVQRRRALVCIFYTMKVVVGVEIQKIWSGRRPLRRIGFHPECTES